MSERIHYTINIHFKKTVCGKYNEKVSSTDEWKFVNCKNCLGFKELFEKLDAKDGREQ